MMIKIEEFLLVGQNAVVRKIVQKTDTGSNYSTGLNELLATPSCIDMVIRASVEAVDKFLPEGYITVGHAVEFVHDKATLLGMTVNIKATLSDIDGKRLIFTIDAWDELGDIGHGRHERLVVRREEIIRRAKERAKYLSPRTF